MIAFSIKNCLGDKNQNKKKDVFGVIGLFSILFVITSFFCFFWFIKFEKSFVWYSDGLYTHYNFLAYFGEYLRTIAHNVFHGKFSLPMWDFSFGYGADIITTINARIGDPLNYFAIFVSPEDTEILHNVLVVLRVYLAGVSFCYYCKTHEKNTFNILIGAIMYCFCGLIFWAGVRHPYFINPMIYFPLLLLGAERVLEKKSPALFIVMVFLSAIGNFYFFYMLTILTVVFIFVKFLLTNKNNVVVLFFKTLLRFMLCYVAGVFLASPLFLPNVIAFFNNARKDIKPSESLLLYDSKYYLEFIQRWITQGTEYGDALGFVALALILCVGAFFIKNKELKYLKILFVTLTVFMLIPFFGYVLNGFGYVTNRWMFVYAFLIAYISVCMLDYIKELVENKKIKYALFALLVYISIVSIFNEAISTSTIVCSVGILGISLFVVFDIVPILLERNKGIYVKGIILLVTIFSVVINAEYRFSPFKENYISEYNDFGTAYDILHNSSAAEVSKLNDSSFYRIDETDNILNTSIAQAYNGISFYTSLVDYHIDDFHKMYCVNNLKAGTVYNYKGLDRRSYLENFFGVRYFTTKNTDTNIPYDFYPVINSDSGNTVYKNNNNTSICYVYDDYILQEELELLSVEKRQEILLQSVVLENPLPKYNESNYTIQSKSLNYNLSYNDGFVADSDILYNDTNSKLVFEFEPQSNCEIYVKINNLKYEDVKKSNNSNLSKYDAFLMETNDKYKEPITSFRIMAESSTSYQSVTHRTSEDRYYAGVDDYFINLGYYSGERDWCKLSFSATGNYSFDSIEIISQPVDSINGYLANLNDCSLSDLRLETNHVCCDLELQEDKILFFTVPYNNGWEAIVDGEIVDIFCGNYMGIAIPLAKGKHSVVLQYRTPGFLIGVVISICTVLILVGINLFIKIKRK